MHMLYPVTITAYQINSLRYQLPTGPSLINSDNILDMKASGSGTILTYSMGGPLNRKSERIQFTISETPAELIMLGDGYVDSGVMDLTVADSISSPTSNITYNPRRVIFVTTYNGSTSYSYLYFNPSLSEDTILINDTLENILELSRYVSGQPSISDTWVENEAWTDSEAWTE